MQRTMYDKECKGAYMITTCIFDLDGTLVDSLADLADATNIVLQKYGFPTHQIEAYRQFVGDGVNMLLQRALPEDKKGLVLACRKYFDEVYNEICLTKTRPYPGIEQLLAKLKNQGKQLAIVTNKPDALAKKITNYLFPNSFVYVYGNSDAYPRKPDPFLINKVIELLSVNKDEVLYIGDSDVDMFTGKNAGVKTMGVAWGFRGKEELLASGADIVVENPKMIGEYIDDSSK